MLGIPTECRAVGRVEPNLVGGRNGERDAVGGRWQWRASSPRQVGRLEGSVRQVRQQEGRRGFLARDRGGSLQVHEQQQDRPGDLLHDRGCARQVREPNPLRAN